MYSWRINEQCNFCRTGWSAKLRWRHNRIFVRTRSVIESRRLLTQHRTRLAGNQRTTPLVCVCVCVWECVSVCVRVCAAGKPNNVRISSITGTIRKRRRQNTERKKGEWRRSQRIFSFRHRVIYYGVLCRSRWIVWWKFTELWVRSN